MIHPLQKLFQYNRRILILIKKDESISELLVQIVNICIPVAVKSLVHVELYIQLSLVNT